jgi:hypothetical protein
VDGDAAAQAADRLPPGEVEFGAGFWGVVERESREVTRVLRFASH